MTFSNSPLKNSVRFVRGITFKPDNKVTPGIKGSVVCMRTKNIQRDLDQDDLIAVPSSFVKREEQYLSKGDILISSANSWELVGKCSYVPELPYLATLGGFISLIRANSNIDSRYLYHWLNSPFIQHKARHCGRQTTNISNLDIERFLDLELPLPNTIEEQRRIAAILDKADAIRRKHEQALTLADQYLRATFLEMFGDPRRNTKSFPTAPLSKVATIARGRFSPRPRNDPKFYGGEFPFIQTGDVNRAYGYLESWTQTLNERGTRVSKAFDKGTVVIAIVGATIGETAILDQETYFPDSVIGIGTTSDNLNSEYLEYVLRFWKQVFRDQAPETARANINIETLKPLSIPLPQKEDLTKFQNLYKKIHRQSLTKKFPSQELYASLSQRAFRGEL